MPRPIFALRRLGNDESELAAVRRELQIGEGAQIEGGFGCEGS